MIYLSGGSLDHWPFNLMVTAKRILRWEILKHTMEDHPNMWLTLRTSPIVIWTEFTKPQSSFQFAAPFLSCDLCALCSSSRFLASWVPNTPRQHTSVLDCSIVMTEITSIWVLLWVSHFLLQGNLASLQRDSNHWHQRGLWLSRDSTTPWSKTPNNPINKGNNQSLNREKTTTKPFPSNHPFPTVFQVDPEKSRWKTWQNQPKRDSTWSNGLHFLNRLPNIRSEHEKIFEITTETFEHSNPSKIEWDLTNGPLSKLLELLYRYSGFFGVRSAGPVGDFLDP